MMRWLFNIFALISFLLCVATVVLWVRSFTWHEWCTWYYRADNNNNLNIHSTHDGEIYVRGGLEDPGIPRLPSATNYYHRMHKIEIWFGSATIFGIGAEVEEFSGPSEGIGATWIVRIPHCWVAYIFAGLPILWCFSTYRRVRIKRRLRNKQCLVCGYSLQGAVTDACPECGVKYAVGVAVEGA